jgi:hypothetical protein
MQEGAIWGFGVALVGGLVASVTFAIIYALRFAERTRATTDLLIVAIFLVIAVGIGALSLSTRLPRRTRTLRLTRDHHRAVVHRPGARTMTTDGTM